ncbi:MAG: hypothetical protein HXX12_08165 [Geothrix sp.]|uniref:hypothetical protein n=1 Tax=Geothrix sp. TaxID=1962974 RepID=UPI0017FE72A6|nr:hypothetical protein [Geothrix sp.]NWJ40932.1 hypothetical protein [Geothrix sp.]WIL21068.1 MAG: hypothetical protein QOZ81_000314 [Geothrix sp.]
MDHPPPFHSPRPEKSPPLRRRGLLLSLVLLAGCTPPLLRQAQPAELRAEWLAFLVDGRTTREEVLLRLGTPSAHLEGERILTYAFSRRASGARTREGRSLDREQKVPVFRAHGMENLVLVFAADGSLIRHSLVVSE